MTRLQDRPNTVLSIATAGGSINCRRCAGTSRRTGSQCGAPAERGKNWCRFHGGRATGPRSTEGRLRCMQARLIHGRDTTRARKRRSGDSARLATLEAVASGLGMIDGPSTRGRKPRDLGAAYPELWHAFIKLLVSSRVEKSASLHRPTGDTGEPNSTLTPHPDLCPGSTYRSR
jgi:hypothetical protein